MVNQAVACTIYELIFKRYTSNIILMESTIYIEINTWPFPYQPGYHPETPISARDAVDGWYGSRGDSQDDMEKVMY